MLIPTRAPDFRTFYTVILYALFLPPFFLTFSCVFVALTLLQIVSDATEKKKDETKSLSFV